MRNTIDWRAAIYAGLIAGVAATAVQIMLWLMFWDVLPWIIFRDARLTAAMVLGPHVLPPPVTFDGGMLAIAAVLHFSLSVAYAIILAWLVRGVGMLAALAIGVVFGLAIYGLNMYLLTAVFPWFAVVRDWITMMTHVAFGIVATACYKLLASRPRAGAAPRMQVSR